MSDAIRLAVFGAIPLVIVGAIFGVLMAKMLWSEDLQQAQRLRDIWNRSEAALRSTIDSQGKTIDSQGKTIDLLRGSKQ